MPDDTVLLERHFDLAFDAPDGIQKLRELILILAMQGKLVPQDPNDQPSSELLKAIEAEKQRLEKEKGLRTAADEHISESEEYIGRPLRWEYCRLGNLARFIDYRGRTPKKVASGIPLITAKNVRFGFINREPYEYITEDEYESWMTRGYPKLGDLLFTTEAPLGNIAVIDIRERFALAQRVICLQLHKPAIGNFLKWLIMSVPFQKQLLDNATGMTAQGIKSARLKEIPIPLPPLAEQHRIVAKIDRLMARCDELEKLRAERNQKRITIHTAALDRLLTAKESDDFSTAWRFITQHFGELYSVKENVAELRKAILQLAVMGKLVPQDPNDEPASELLKAIEAEKQQLVKEGKLKPPKPLTELKPEEIPYELPKGWEWANLQDLLAIVNDGDHQPPPKAGSGIPFLVIGNLNTGRISFNGCRFVPENYYQSLDWGRKPALNDVLYTVTGSYGIPIHVDKGDKFCVQRHVAILKSVKSSPIEYLTRLLKSNYAFSYATSVATGIAQKTVPLSGLRKMPIAIPPVNEQRRIVAKIDQLMAHCDQLEKQIDAATNKRTTLLNAVMAQA